LFFKTPDRQRAIVVDELAERFRRHAALDVRIEDLEEIFDAVGGRVLAEGGESLERAQVGLGVVDEGDGIEAEIGEAGRRHVLQRHGAERPRRPELAVAVRPCTPDVGRVVGAECRLDGAALEHAGLVQQLEVGCRDQHDVELVLADDLGDLFQELGARAEAHEAALVVADGAGAGDRIGHVAVLGVGDDEVALGVFAGADLGELGIEAGHEGSLRDGRGWCRADRFGGEGRGCVHRRVSQTVASARPAG
jgi:hypothetical protein